MTTQIVTFIGNANSPTEAINIAHAHLDTAWLASGYVEKGKRIICSTTMTHAPDDRFRSWIFTITCEFRGPV